MPVILVEEKVDAAPPDKEAFSYEGIVQVYNVPEGMILLPITVGVILNKVPVQIVVLIFAIEGLGFK